MDYLLSHSVFLTLTNRPLSVNVTLLNDGESGEGLETINLTLVQNHQLTPSNQNQILYYKSVVITLQDTDSKWKTPHYLYRSSTIARPPSSIIIVS